MVLDKYARDSIRWCESAIQDHLAARILFASGNQNPLVFFTAATIAHHALEMYLKSALIVAGLTIFKPERIKDLNASEKLSKDQCAWGHELPKLARTLTEKQPMFDLKMRLDIPRSVFQLNIVGPAGRPVYPDDQQLTVEQAFEHFEPFFGELRYPREYENFYGVGADDSVILDKLVHALRHFLPDDESCKQWNLLQYEHVNPT